MYTLLLLLGLFFSSTIQCFGQNSRFVDPFIGTDGTGHTFPGASLPFGMVQPSPDCKDIDWAYTSGYQFADSIIIGFSQTHLSGTGIGELGDILLLPYSKYEKRNILDKNSEKASPGYYSVTKSDGVKVELTCSERVAFHKYTFPTRDANLYIDIQHGIRFLTDSLVLSSDVRVEDNFTISGVCHTKNWVERTYAFLIKFDTPIKEIKKLAKKEKENAPKYNIVFHLADSCVLKAKIALSTTDINGATKNLNSEIPHWNFNKIKIKAKDIWEKYLGRINIDADEEKKKVFYTCLYHLLLQPSNIADIDGRYRGADNKIHISSDSCYFSTLSNWDIYRTAFPLLQLIVPEVINPIINSMLEHHKIAGFLPIWTVWGQDNYCMIGNHAIPMIVSAYNNGFDGFNKEKAFNAIVETSERPHIHSLWDIYNKYKYYPYDIVKDESVSKALENGYDDWCVSYMAEMLGDKTTAEIYQKRSKYYKNIFDNETKLFRGKDSKGEWRKKFDPFTPTSPMNNPGDYTEANAWQYFWTPAQHDIEGIIDLLGNKNEFTKHLDFFFNKEMDNHNKYLGQEAMIGQYAHGNEPCHHVTYLYKFSEKPWKGDYYIRHIIDNFYTSKPNGLNGNDDCGQMSAWYIMSCLGIYPVNPANGEFVFGAPQLRKAEIKMDNNKIFKIIAKDISKENIYVSEIRYNGVKRKKTISYKEIKNGGLLEFQMSSLIKMK